jgi:hypothetical protein
MLLVKVIILLLLGFVMISLFSGLYFLVKDKGQSNRTVNALSVRIGLSIVAIIVVAIAGATGVINFNPGPLSGQAPAREQSREILNGAEEHKPGSGRKLIQPN